jgi:hypothetical protein
MWVWQEKQRLMEKEWRRQQRNVAEERQQELLEALLANADSYGRYLDMEEEYY